MGPDPEHRSEGGDAVGDAGCATLGQRVASTESEAVVTSLQTALTALLASSVLPLQAASLSGSFTADDNLTIFVAASLNPGAGDMVYNKTSLWGSTESFAGFALPDGQDLYLLVDALNWSGPAMLVGDFSLTGGGFTFANGGSTLTTDTVHWTVGETSFATAGGTPFSMGVNGPGLQIWGQRPGIAATADAIWAYNADWSAGRPGHAYFVTRLVAEVPEPETWALFIAGLGLVSLQTRRRLHSA